MKKTFELLLVLVVGLTLLAGCGGTPAAPPETLEAKITKAPWVSESGKGSIIFSLDGTCVEKYEGQADVKGKWILKDNKQIRVQYENNKSGDYPYDIIFKQDGSLDFIKLIGGNEYRQK